MPLESEFDDTERRSLFSSHAAAYGDGRPGYPSQLFDHLRTACKLDARSRVLEIGAGAGQATGPLLDTGAEVLAIEVGEEFAQLLRSKFASDRLEVKVGEFETVDVEPGSFDLVAAATSFHWIEPERGLKRVADLLRPNGFVALWWTHFGDPERPDPFRDAVQPLLEQHAPHLTDSITGGAGIGAHPYALDSEARRSEIASAGRFGPVSEHRIAWTATQTAVEMQRFLASFSSWMALESDVRTKLLREIGDLINGVFGGAVERPFVTAIYTAARA